MRMPGARRRPGPISEAARWSHGRLKFFELADLRKAPLAIEAVRRIDAIFAIEREINGATAEQRLAGRKERVKPLVDELGVWMRTERARLSRHADIAKAIDYMLKRWPPSRAFSMTSHLPVEQRRRARFARRLLVARRPLAHRGRQRHHRRHRSPHGRNVR